MAAASLLRSSRSTRLFGSTCSIPLTPLCSTARTKLDAMLSSLLSQKTRRCAATVFPSFVITSSLSTPWSVTSPAAPIAAPVRNER